MSYDPRSIDDAAWVSHGSTSSFSAFGIELAWLDLTGTGPELIVGASGVSPVRVGAIYAFDPAVSGDVGVEAATRRITGGRGLGRTFVGWDSDGDGLDELVAEADRAVLHFPGPWLADLVEADADLAWDERGAGDNLGVTLERIGDLDGDGIGDLAMGADNLKGPELRSGALYVVQSGAPSPGPAANLAFQVNGTLLGEAVGSAAAAGDYDGDGIVDLVLGASGVYPGSLPGKILGFFGPVPVATLLPADADWIVTGEADADFFGVTAVTVDSDGDERDDLVVGAQGWGGGRGKIYVFLGADLAP